MIYPCSYHIMCVLVANTIHMCGQYNTSTSVNLYTLEDNIYISPQTTSEELCLLEHAEPHFRQPPPLFRPPTTTPPPRIRQPRLRCVSEESVDFGYIHWPNVRSDLGAPHVVFFNGPRFVSLWYERKEINKGSPSGTTPHTIRRDHIRLKASLSIRHATRPVKGISAGFMILF